MKQGRHNKARGPNPAGAMSDSLDSSLAGLMVPQLILAPGTALTTKLAATAPGQHASAGRILKSPDDQLPTYLAKNASKAQPVTAGGHRQPISYDRSPSPPPSSLQHAMQNASSTEHDPYGSSTISRAAALKALKHQRMSGGGELSTGHVPAQSSTLPGPELGRSSASFSLPARLAVDAYTRGAGAMTSSNAGASISNNELSSHHTTQGARPDMGHGWDSSGLAAASSTQTTWQANNNTSVPWQEPAPIAAAGGRSSSKQPRTSDAILNLSPSKRQSQVMGLQSASVKTAAAAAAAAAAGGVADRRGAKVATGREDTGPDQLQAPLSGHQRAAKREQASASKEDEQPPLQSHAHAYMLAYIAELEAQLAAERAETDQLQRKQAAAELAQRELQLQLEEALFEGNEHKAAAEVAQAERNASKAACADLQAALAKSQAAQARSTATSKELHATLDTTLGAAEHAARELHKLRSVHASQAEALQAAQERVAHEAAQHTAKQQTERQLRDEVVLLQSRLRDAIDGIEALRRDSTLSANRLRAEVESSAREAALARTSLAKLQREHQTVLGRKSERDKSSAVLVRRMEALETAHSALLRERREEEGDISALESRLALLRQRNTALERQLAQERDSRIQAEQQVRGVDAEMRALLGVTGQAEELGVTLTAPSPSGTPGQTPSRQRSREFSPYARMHTASRSISAGHARPDSYSRGAAMAAARSAASNHRGRAGGVQTPSSADQVPGSAASQMGESATGARGSYRRRQAQQQVQGRTRSRSAGVAAARAAMVSAELEAESAAAAAAAGAEEGAMRRMGREVPFAAAVRSALSYSSAESSAVHLGEHPTQYMHAQHPSGTDTSQAAANDNAQPASQQGRSASNGLPTALSIYPAKHFHTGGHMLPPSSTPRSMHTRAFSPDRCGMQPSVTCRAGAGAGTGASATRSWTPPGRSAHRSPSPHQRAPGQACPTWRGSSKSPSHAFGRSHGHIQGKDSDPQVSPGTAWPGRSRSSSMVQVAQGPSLGASVEHAGGEGARKHASGTAQAKRVQHPAPWVSLMKGTGNAGVKERSRTPEWPRRTQAAPMPSRARTPDGTSMRIMHPAAASPPHISSLLLTAQGTKRVTAQPHHKVAVCASQGTVHLVHALSPASSAGGAGGQTHGSYDTSRDPAGKASTLNANAAYAGYADTAFMIASVDDDAYTRMASPVKSSTDAQTHGVRSKEAFRSSYAFESAAPAAVHAVSDGGSSAVMGEGSEHAGGQVSPLFGEHGVSPSLRERHAVLMQRLQGQQPSKEGKEGHGHAGSNASAGNMFMSPVMDGVIDGRVSGHAASAVACNASAGGSSTAGGRLLQTSHEDQLASQMAAAQSTLANISSTLAGMSLNTPSPCQSSAVSDRALGDASRGASGSAASAGAGPAASATSSMHAGDQHGAVNSCSTLSTPQQGFGFSFLKSSPDSSSPGSAARSMYVASSMSSSGVGSLAATCSDGNATASAPIDTRAASATSVSVQVPTTLAASLQLQQAHVHAPAEPQCLTRLIQPATPNLHSLPSMPPASMSGVINHRFGSDGGERRVSFAELPMHHSTQQGDAHAGQERSVHSAQLPQTPTSGGGAGYGPGPISSSVSLAALVAGHAGTPAGAASPLVPYATPLGAAGSTLNTPAAADGSGTPAAASGGDGGVGPMQALLRDLRFSSVSPSNSSAGSKPSQGTAPATPHMQPLSSSAASGLEPYSASLHANVNARHVGGSRIPGLTAQPSAGDTSREASSLFSPGSDMAPAFSRIPLPLPSSPAAPLVPAISNRPTEEGEESEGDPGSHELPCDSFMTGGFGFSTGGFGSEEGQYTGVFGSQQGVSGHSNPLFRGMAADAHGDGNDGPIVDDDMSDELSQVSGLSSDSIPDARDEEALPSGEEYLPIPVPFQASAAQSSCTTSPSEEREGMLYGSGCGSGHAVGSSGLAVSGSKQRHGSLVSPQDPPGSLIGSMLLSSGSGTQKQQEEQQQQAEGVPHEHGSLTRHVHVHGNVVQSNNTSPTASGPAYSFADDEEVSVDGSEVGSSVPRLLERLSMPGIAQHSHAHNTLHADAAPASAAAGAAAGMATAASMQAWSQPAAAAGNSWSAPAAIQRGAVSAVSGLLETWLAQQQLQAALLQPSASGSDTARRSALSSTSAATSTQGASAVSAVVSLLADSGQSSTAPGLAPLTWGSAATGSTAGSGGGGMGGMGVRMDCSGGGSRPPSPGGSVRPLSLQDVLRS